MKKEHEQILEGYLKEGKVRKDYHFYVLHKLLKKWHMVPGNVIQRFIADSDSYYIQDTEPEEIRLEREEYEYKKLEKEAEETQALADAVAALAAKKASKRVNKENQNNE